MKTLLDLRKTPRGRAILFFGAYFFFFLLLIIISRFGNRTSNYKYDDFEKNKVSFDSIANNNYNFTYSVFLDDMKYIFTGERNGDITKINYLDNVYYKINDNYYDSNNMIVDNPIIFSLFLDNNNYDNICENSYYESKTEYEDSHLRFDYLLSTNTINSLFYNIESDYNEEANKIVYSTDKDKDVYQINYILDSYCLLNNLCERSLKIEIAYDKFGEISKIENPISNSSE